MRVGDYPEQIRIISYFGDYPEYLLMVLQE